VAARRSWLAGGDGFHAAAGDDVRRMPSLDHRRLL